MARLGGVQAYMAKLMVKAELPNHLRNLVRQARSRDVGLQVSLLAV